jgi:hypothetical protein
MTPNALTRDELIAKLQSLGNFPVVWSGRTGLLKDAVGDAVIVHPNGRQLISLEPASKQSNVGDVPTTPDVLRVRDELRAAKSRFVEHFDLFVAGHITRLQFDATKNDYDAVIGRVLEVLNKF